MSRKSTIPTRRGFGRTYWHLLAWIGWTCLVLGVSAMSMTGSHSDRAMPVQLLWPVDSLDGRAAGHDGHIDHALLMSSSVPAEADPGPETIAKYDF